MSVIYKIYCKDPNIKDCYVGSTNDLKARKRQHKTVCNNSNDKSYTFKIYEFIRANSGFENFDFIILEQFENIMTKKDLLKIEGQYIKNNNATLNSQIAGRTKKEYYDDNKKELYKNAKIYREQNKEKIVEYRKQYREENKTKLKEDNKVKYEKNKEQISEKNKVKIICEFCKSLINKSSLKRHQQSKKCIECKNNIL